MLTKQQAIEANVFHYGDCQVKTERWRRNGRTQTWKTRPEDWLIPVKHGLYNYSHIGHTEAAVFHIEKDCPRLKRGD